MHGLTFGLALLHFVFLEFAMAGAISATWLWPENFPEPTGNSCGKCSRPLNAMHSSKDEVVLLQAGVHQGKFFKSAACEAEGVVWDTETGTKGSFQDGTVVTSNAFAPVVTERDFFGDNFSFAPLGSRQSAVEYGVSSFVINLSQPVTNLALYALEWRGSGFTSVENITYTFSQKIQLESGFDSTGLVVDQGDNFITLSTTAGLGSGIFTFPHGPFTELSIQSSLSSEGKQFFTVGKYCVKDGYQAGRKYHGAHRGKIDIDISVRVMKAKQDENHAYAND